MQHEPHQRLSAVLDQETTAAETAATLDQLLNNPELEARWERYHLIGGVIRGEPVSPDYRLLAQSVAARLATEPLVSTLPPPRRWFIPWFEHWMPLAGAAMASVMLLGVMVWHPAVDGLLNQQSLTHPDRMLALATEQPPALDTVDAWPLNEPALESKLHWFVLGHQESASFSGFQGHIPYATLVGYDGQ